MRTVVIGAGEVGSDVARILALEEHDVTVVDNDEEVLQSIQNNYDVLTVEGNGTSVNVLEDAGIRNAGLLVAVTAVDEVNIIACMMADRLGVETTIARTRTDELERAHSVLEAEDFGIDLVIHPEESAAVEITQLISGRGPPTCSPSVMTASNSLECASTRMPRWRTAPCTRWSPSIRRSSFV